jgi:hypothetical protein
LTGRNEPIEVPDAMGACLVKGLNNWSRVAAYRANWSRATGESNDEAWASEFQKLIPSICQPFRKFFRETNSDCLVHVQLRIDWT